MGHGTHWEAVLRNFGEDAAAAALKQLLEKGSIVGKRHRSSWNGPAGVEAATVTLIQTSENGLGILGVMVSTESDTYLHTAFPVTEGIAHRVRIVEVHESSFTMEGCITALIGDTQIHFFDPYYALCAELYHPGAELDISLAGIGYSLAVSKYGKTISDPQIGNVSLKGAAILVPINEPKTSPPSTGDFGLSHIQSKNSGLDDYCFLGPVKRVQTVDFATQPAFRLTVTLLRYGGDIDIPIYVLEDRISEGPDVSVGADVEGALWMQGTAFRGKR